MYSHTRESLLTEASTRGSFPKLNPVPLLTIVLCILAHFGVAEAAQAQQTQTLVAPPSEVNSHSDSGPGSTAAEANNPVAPLNQLQIQNWYNASDYGTTGESNVSTGESNLFLIRPVLTFRQRGWIPPQLTRPAFSLFSAPNGRTGIGDFSAFDLFFVVDRPTLRVGIGPAIVVPTGTNKYAGQGKWQAGPSAAVIYTGVNRLVIGVLEINSISFAGERDRQNLNTTSLQPIIVKSFQHEWFLREDPILAFDWREHGTAVVPVNLGIGHVWKIGRRPVNTYVQSEWTVRRPPYSGYDPPRFTLRLVCNLLYPHKEE